MIPVEILANGPGHDNFKFVSNMSRGPWSYRRRMIFIYLPVLGKRIHIILEQNVQNLHNLRSNLHNLRTNLHNRRANSTFFDWIRFSCMICAYSCKISLTLTQTHKTHITSRDLVQSRATFQELSTDQDFLAKNALTTLLLSQTHKITYSSSPLSQLILLF